MAGTATQRKWRHLQGCTVRGVNSHYKHVLPPLGWILKASLPVPQGILPDGGWGDANNAIRILVKDHLFPTSLKPSSSGEQRIELRFSQVGTKAMFPPGPVLCSTAVMSLPVPQPIAVLSYKPMSQKPGPSPCLCNFKSLRLVSSSTEEKSNSGKNRPDSGESM